MRLMSKFLVLLLTLSSLNVFAESAQDAEYNEALIRCEKQKANDVRDLRLVVLGATVDDLFHGRLKFRNTRDAFEYLSRQSQIDCEAVATDLVNRK